MAGSKFGEIFQITTWGESHGKALGVVIDGCPAELSLCEDDIQKYLNRRRPGTSQFATKRTESDSVQILSGVFEGKTTGCPISLIVFNEDQRSADYSEIAQTYRPGHADFCYDAKYGVRDYRGGGRSSARETLARVAAGTVALKILEELGVSVAAYTKAIGDVCIDDSKISLSERFNNPLCMPNAEAATRAEALLNRVMAEGDSVGGVVECVLEGTPKGIGEPVFNKLDAALASAIMSVNAVKGIEFGSGFKSAALLGSQNNDHMRYDEHLTLQKPTNHAGGIYGGIADGSPIVFRAAIKPTPSISRPQNTVNATGENVEISTKGRHDPVIAPRAVVVIEAMAALVLVDYIFMGMTSKMDGIKRFFEGERQAAL